MCIYGSTFFLTSYKETQHMLCKVSYLASAAVSFHWFVQFAFRTKHFLHSDIAKNKKHFKYARSSALSNFTIVQNNKRSLKSIKAS